MRSVHTDADPKFTKVDKALRLVSHYAALTARARAKEGNTLGAEE